MEAAFRQHDWENDEGWLAIRRRLEIPPNLDEQTVLLKRKRKYYKDTINPDYEPPSDPQPSPSPTPSPSSSTSTSSTSSSRPSTSSSSSSSRGYPRFSDPFASHAFMQAQQYPDSDLITSIGTGTPASIIRGSYLVVLALTLVYILPFISAEYAISLFYLILKVGIFAEGALVFHQLGVPQFNRNYGIKLMTNEVTFWVLLSFAAHMVATPSIIILLPLLLRALSFTVALLSPFIPASIRSHPAFTNLTASLPSRLHKLYLYAAVAEWLVILILIPLALTPIRSLIFLLLQLQLLRLRYVSSI